MIIIYIADPPECTDHGITLVKETLKCNVRALPVPDTYFWHIQPTDADIQHLTTGSAILPLAQITGALSRSLEASCEAGNGIASQDKPCKKVFTFEQLRPPQPQQCDLAYEYEEFLMRCMPGILFVIFSWFIIHMYYVRYQVLVFFIHQSGNRTQTQLLCLQLLCLKCI